MATDEQCRISELQRGIRTEEHFHWLFARYYQPVFSFFRRRGIPADRSDDLTQEVFLRVYKGIARFRGEARFDTWLFRIAWNLWCKQLRTTAAGEGNIRNVVLNEVTEAEAHLSFDPAAAERREQDDPLLRALDRERKELLQLELRQMPPQMRRCAVLRIDRQLKYREIAELMQISIDAVKSHLNQARSRLKAALASAPGSEYSRRRPHGRA
jgi:RNA polymerase sigma-70 factor, ECF subfamily